MNKEEPFWHKQIFFYDLLGEKRLIMKHKAVSVKANLYVQMGLKFNQSIYSWSPHSQILGFPSFEEMRLGLFRV